MTNRKYKPDGKIIGLKYGPDIMGSKVVYHGNNFYTELMLFDKEMGGDGLALTICEKDRIKTNWHSTFQIQGYIEFFQEKLKIDPTSDYYTQELQLYREALSFWNSYQKSTSLEGKAEK